MVMTAAAQTYAMNIVLVNLFAVLLMVSVVAIAYMLGKASGKQEYVAFAKVELFQVLMSVLLLIFALGIIGVFEEFMSAASGGNPKEKVLAYFDHLLYDEQYGAVPEAFELKKKNLFYEVIAAFGQRVSYTGWGVAKGIEIPKALGTVGMAMTNAMYLPLSVFIPSVYLQRYLVEVVSLISLQIILPVGIFLRVFPPTRTGGTFLIALAIGLSTIFIFTYVMHSETVMNHLSPEKLEEKIDLSSQGNAPMPIAARPIKCPDNIWGDLRDGEQDSFMRRDVMIYHCWTTLKYPGMKTKFESFVKTITENRFVKDLKEISSSTGGSIGDYVQEVSKDSGISPTQQYMFVYSGYVYLQRIAKLYEAAPALSSGRNFNLLMTSIARKLKFAWVFGFGVGYLGFYHLFFVASPKTLSILSYIVLQGIFLPSLSFVITIAFIQALYRYLLSMTT